MAVPKKRTGHSAQGKRRSNWKATRPEVTTCPNCGATVLTHTVCTACGTYKGKAVRLKDKAEEAKAAETKAAAPKASKKAKTEKAAVEEKAETVVVEEVKETPAEAKAEEAKEEASETTAEIEEK